MRSGNETASCLEVVSFLSSSLTLSCTAMHTCAVCDESLGGAWEEPGRRAIMNKDLVSWERIMGCRAINCVP